MANKKYLDLEGLEHYDESIKDYVENKYSEVIFNSDELILDCGTYVPKEEK